MNADAVSVRVRSVELYERPVTLRLPFRFGAATVTRCPQAFVRVLADVNGHSVEGAGAELMVPKWFDKSPALTHEQNFEQLREALRLARDAYGSADAALTPWALSLQGDDGIASGVAFGLPRLAAQFGAALLDKAVADAALQAAGLPWVGGLRAGVLGDPWSAKLPLHTPDTVALRHTVGLADRLDASDPGADPQDGLPATLRDAIAAHGLRFFKLKLCGDAERDIARLRAIAAVLDAHAGDYRVTLDGNETFTDAAALGAFWRALAATAALQPLLARTLLLEQPIGRARALREPIDGLGIPVPVILDESDDHAEAFDTGLSLGYRGISSKACKGIYRSLRNAARVAEGRGRLLLSGEDLTAQAGLAVQQDTALAASLGVTHIERNGHHYVDGFGIAPDGEAQGFLQAHPSLYAMSNGRVRLAVHDGQLQLRSLFGTAGFAGGATPRWDTLTPIH
ncbi:MAG TPA: enolase C-terminal domain-like protein [Burkholderiaceae bacterium]|nr:enolase C-terminal domain-like protein [Burkholderiaceae bacterium]